MPSLSPDELKAIGGLGSGALVFLSLLVLAVILWTILKAVTSGSLTGGAVIHHIAEMVTQSGQAQERNALTLDRVAQGQEQILQLIRNLREDLHDLERDVKDLRSGWR